MKILFANKYYYIKGGAERYMLALRALLMKNWHAVYPFAMMDPHNLPTEWKRFFVSAVKTHDVSFSLAGLKTAGRILYSFEAKRKFGAMLDKVKPDIVHIHNIYHQISPSILSAAKKRGIPIVLTAHDYALIAPNYNLFHDGAICEITKPDKYWNAVGHKCVKNSKVASGLEAVAMRLHKTLKLWDNVDVIVTPSRFMTAKLIEYGFPAEKLTHIHHFIDTTAWTPRYEGSYALYVSRLSPEKGADILVRAAAKNKDIPVRIVGAGPQEVSLKKLAAELGATNVEFRGFKTGGDLLAEYADARFVVVPSVCYEGFPLTTLEAAAAGKPSIASQIGGLGEGVKDGETGVFVSAGNVDELAEAMSELWADPAICAEMGKAGRAWIEKDFTPQGHYDRMMEVYRSVSSASPT